MSGIDIAFAILFVFNCVLLLALCTGGSSDASDED